MPSRKLLSLAPRQKFPVILFSHGLRENTFRYSAQLEQLASYGYIVVAIDHTYDNQATVFPDGRVARWSNRWEWAFSNDGPDEQRFIIAQLGVMVGDISFVVDELYRLNDEPSGIFNGKLDLDRLGFFGHSLGGAIAPLVCQTDLRFKACLNQDGVPTGKVVILDSAKHELQRPFMFLASRDPVTDETLQLMALTRVEYERHYLTWQRHAFHVLDTMPVESYVISINGATHAGFTDNPTLAADSLPTYRKRARTLQVIRDYTRAFFDKYLPSSNPVLLDSASYPEATTVRYGKRAGP
jgi:pimeloyl-ACP methyl ester carboxylesterase